MAPDGKSLLHAELQIGDSRIFLNDEFPEMGALLARWGPTARPCRFTCTSRMSIPCTSRP